MGETRQPLPLSNIGLPERFIPHQIVFKSCGSTFRSNYANKKSKPIENPEENGKCIWTLFSSGPFFFVYMSGGATSESKTKSLWYKLSA
jgi:hypothetical protein